MSIGGVNKETPMEEEIKQILINHDNAEYIAGGYTFEQCVDDLSALFYTKMEEIIGEDEEKIKLPVMQIQEQNNYEKENRNELRSWQRKKLLEVLGK